MSKCLALSDRVMAIVPWKQIL